MGKPTSLCVPRLEELAKEVKAQHQSTTEATGLSACCKCWAEGPSGAGAWGFPGWGGGGSEPGLSPATARVSLLLSFYFSVLEFHLKFCLKKALAVKTNTLEATGLQHINSGDKNQQKF